MPKFGRVIKNLEYNFSRCNNHLETLASFDSILFLNNDIIFSEDPAVLKRAYERLRETENVGILGSVLLYPNHRVQHMGCDFLKEPDLWGLPFHINAGQLPSTIGIPQESYYPGVTGAFLMIRRSLFRLCGGFDEQYETECQDIALCLEAQRRGFRTICIDLGALVHIENGTRPKGEENLRDRRRFLRKFGRYLEEAFK